MASHRELTAAKARIRASGSRAETMAARRAFNARLARWRHDALTAGGQPVADVETWSSNFSVPDTQRYIQAEHPDAIEIKHGGQRTLWASNLADAPPGVRPMEVASDGSPVFANSEALFQWMKARFFDERLHLARYGVDAYPEAEGRNIVQSTFTADLTGAQAKSRAGQGAFARAIGAELGNKEKATRLYKKILPEWFAVSYQVMQEVIRAKFGPRNPHLVELLLGTGTRPLYEGRRRAGSVWEVASESHNRRGDVPPFASLGDDDPRKWGFLGTILMRRRDELRRQQQQPPPPPPKRKRAASEGECDVGQCAKYAKK